jgi:mRNA interferase RelE/StbE
MSYRYEYSDDAKKDLDNFNKSQIAQIENAVLKVSQNPLPQNEGGYGKPLGNKHGNNLTGLCKIKLKKLGIRVVYKLIRTETAMKIIVVSVRNDNEVYDIAANRIDKF